MKMIGKYRVYDTHLNNKIYAKKDDSHESSFNLVIMPSLPLTTTASNGCVRPDVFWCRRWDLNPHNLAITGT